MRTYLASLACLALLAACADPQPPCSLNDAVATYDIPPDADAFLAPVTIEGQTLPFILDTGAETSFVTTQAADRMNLLDIASTERRSGKFISEGAAGSFTGYPAAIRHLQFANGNMTFGAFMVGDLTSHRAAQSDADGLLGADILDNWALDIDRPSGQMRFFDEDKCTVARPPWSGATLSEALTPLPSGEYSAQIRFPLVVNGHTLTAALDTGASGNAITADAAEITGVDTTSDRALKIGGAGGLISTAHVHRFDHVVFQGRDFGPMAMAVLPDMHDPDVLLGRGFLLHHRVFVSHRQHLIFIAPATTPST